MKLRLSLLLLSIVLITSCEKRKFYDRIEGSWFTYEIIHENGNRMTSGIESYSIFGVYNPHIEFKSDKSYVPLARSGNEVLPKSAEAGSYEYISGSSQIFLTGGMLNMVFAIEKSEVDELWLKSITNNKGDLIKLKKG